MDTARAGIVDAVADHGHCPSAASSWKALTLSSGSPPGYRQPQLLTDHLRSPPIVASEHHHRMKRPRCAAPMDSRPRGATRRQSEAG